MISYEGKVALVTGGASGIGFGLAQALVERGAAVALIGTSPERLDKAVAHLTVLGGKAAAFPLDVTDPDRWHSVVAEVAAALGPIDILILNAGAQGGRRVVEDIPLEEWRWVWDVNVNGIYNGLRACLPAMKQRGSEANILITASIAALMPRAQVTAYGASKAAALALGEAVRLELQGGPIQISVLCPAGVRSDIANTMMRHAPGAEAGTFAYMQPVLASGLDPLAVGRYTLDAMAAGHFYIFTHPEFAAPVGARLDGIRTSFADQAEKAATLTEDHR